MFSVDIQPTYYKATSNSLKFYQFLERIINFQLGIQKQIQFSEPTSFQSKRLIKNIYGRNLNTFQKHPNSNLKAIAYIFLIICCKNDGDPGLKSILLSQICSCAKFYQEIINLPYQFQFVNRMDLGRFTIYLLNNIDQLMQNVFEKQIQLTLQKYSVYVELISLFFRVLLNRLKFPHAHDYKHKINTNQVFTIVTEYFDISCQNKQPFYFFDRQELFISSHNNQQFTCGRYQQNRIKLYDSVPFVRQNTSDQLEIGKDNSIIFQLDQDDIKDQKVQKQNKDPKTIKANDFGVFSFRFQSLPKNQNNQKKQQLRTQMNSGAKSFHTDRSIVQQFYPKQSKCDKKSPQSQNIVHHMGSQGYLHDFLIDKRRQNPSLSYLQSKNQYLSSSYHDHKTNYQVNFNKRLQCQNQQLSIISCTCNTEKKKKFTLCSNVCHINFFPVKNQRRKKTIHTHCNRSPNKIPAFILDRQKKRQQNINNPQYQKDTKIKVVKKQFYWSNNNGGIKSSSSRSSNKKRSMRSPIDQITINIRRNICSSPLEKVRFSHRLIK